jgi:DNA-binding GntR family transcriptional regulator
MAFTAAGAPAAGRVALPSSLKQVAMDEIRRRIFTGELRAGMRVDQESLAEEIGMSRIPVREALAALVGEGIIEMIPRRGAFVVPLSPQDIQDHYWMLASISGRAAERAAQHLSDAELNELQELADGMERSTTEHAREQFNFRFHSLINHAAASPRLIATLKMLGSPLPLGFYESHARMAAEADAEHRELLEALRSRSGPDARQAMKHHFLQGANEAVAMLEERGFWDGTSAT